MAKIGGEIEQLAQLKTSFDRQAQAVDQVAATIRADLGNTVWEGPAAERFRAQWSSEFEPALRKLQAALSESGVEVSRRRDALVQAGS
jgi:WXG100 family type VII secretion target